MFRMIKAIIAFAIVLGLVATGTTFAATYEMSRDFQNVKTVSLQTHGGDCIVKNGTDGQVTVEVRYDFRPGQTYEPIFTTSGTKLDLKEVVSENFSGNSSWTVMVPAGTKVDFVSESGNFSVNRAEGVFTAKTSGSIDLEKCQGTFMLHTTDGDIAADGLELTGPSELITENGAVSIGLKSSPEHDLTVASASQNVLLDYNGNPVRGRIEMTCRAHGGQIKAPFAFETDEKFEKDRISYIRKAVSMKGTSPVIAVETASARAELKR